MLYFQIPFKVLAEMHMNRVFKGTTYIPHMEIYIPDIYTTYRDFSYSESKHVFLGNASKHRKMPINTNS